MNTIQEKQADYNTRVERILANKDKVTSSIYEIGLDLKEIKERELYLLEFRDFNEFLEKKVYIARSTAYLCISISSEFSLRDFTKWGLAKLELIKRKFPQETDRKEFLKEPVQSIGHLQDNITDFKLDKGIKEVEHFEGQIGKSRTGEIQLTLVRQWSTIRTHLESLQSYKEGIISEIASFLHSSKNYSQNEQLEECKKEAQEEQERLK